MSRIVKCSNCNLVIDELLAYIVNKMDVIDQESLMRICISSFDEAEIEKSKNLLFDAVSTNIRKIKRRNKAEGKIQRDLEDIITVLKSLDPEKIPIFVAKELQKLPPVTFDHCDVTALLKNIVILKSEIEYIKDTYATKEQLQATEAKVHAFKYDSLINTSKHSHVDRFNFVNTRARGANLMDSGPMAISLYDSATEPTAQVIRHDTSIPNSSVLGATATVPCVSKQCDAVNSVTRACNGNEPATAGSRPATNVNGSAVACASAPQPAPPTAPALASAITESMPMTSCSSRPNSNNTKESAAVTMQSNTDINLLKNTDQSELCANAKLTYSEVGNRNGLWYESPRDEKWEIVQRKRLRNKFVSNKGKASTENYSKFKAAVVKIPLFITNVHRDTTVKDITDYINNKTQEQVTPIKIKMRQQRDYNAFKIFVNKEKIQTFLDDSFWPSGISFRRFVNYNDRNHVNNSLHDKKRQSTNS